MPEMTDEQMLDKLLHLQKKAAELKVRIAQHNPVGMGFDSAFGHKGGGVADEGDGVHQSFLGNSVWFSINNHTNWNGTQGDHFIAFSKPDGLTDRRFWVAGNRHDAGTTIFHMMEYKQCVYDYAESNSYINLTTGARATAGTPDGGFDWAMAPDGTAFVAFALVAGGTDTFRLESLNETAFADSVAMNAVTVTGTDQPPDLEDGFYGVCVVSNTVLWIYHDGSLYKGDITSPTAVAFNTTPIAINIAQYSVDATDGRWICFHAGPDDMLLGIAQERSEGMWNFERFDHTGTSTAEYNDILVYGPNDHVASNEDGQNKSLIHVYGEYCMHTTNGAVGNEVEPSEIISLEDVGWTDDSA